ncbi:Zinc-type alcohol dehydrogenase-like protein [Fusarium oxysporum f. sp. albedinis]|nr:Zinc-type alcohol dehydrogenase-like protein [Fusarium oxysporum f. sp. albedinis]
MLLHVSEFSASAMDPYSLQKWQMIQGVFFSMPLHLVTNSLDSRISARGSRREQPLGLLCGSLRTIMLSPHLRQNIDRR